MFSSQTALWRYLHWRCLSLEASLPYILKLSAIGEEKIPYTLFGSVQRHMVSKNYVPFFQYHLFPTGASLSCDQLKVPSGVISIAFNADFLPQTVTATTLIILTGAQMA